MTRRIYPDNLPRIYACNALLHCLVCGCSEVEDRRNPDAPWPLRPMYQLPEGGLICQVCRDEGRTLFGDGGTNNPVLRLNVGDGE